MTRIFSSFPVLALLTAVLLAAGCRKNDNPKVPDLTRVQIPQITRDASADLIISAVEPEQFQGKITVDVYYKTSEYPMQMDIVVIKNGNKDNIRTLQAGITSFPATVEFDGNDLINLFGEPIVLGDRFDISADVTTSDGAFIPAFPALGVGYSANVAALPGSSTTVRYEAACTFDASEYAGTFEILVDEWGDYGPGDQLEVTVIDETTLSFFFLTDNPQPIIVKVNPASNETSVALQVYGDYDFYGLTDMQTRTVASLDNYVAPCEGVLSLKLEHLDAIGTFGTYLLQMKKIN